MKTSNATASIAGDLPEQSDSVVVVNINRIVFPEQLGVDCRTGPAVTELY